WFKENGYETHVCAKNDYDNKEDCVIPYCDNYYDFPFERSPFKFNNYKTYKKLKELIDSNEFDIIHCHTPVGGALTRLAAKDVRKKGTTVIYTAHGFHFYKGAPLINWFTYYLFEKLALSWTDGLITMNEEDYLSAKKMAKNSTMVFKVNGVGIDLEKFIPQTQDIKRQIRQEYGYKVDDFILIYAGELSYRKNQDLIIDAVSLLKNKIPNLKVLLAGAGPLSEHYKQKVIKLGIEENIEFLGYRMDVNKLMLLSDIAVSASRQEGLPVNIMEAMATGLPLV
ncbi:UDP-Glycosyltransferase/glycogen phosphorylase, partial [Rhizophagus irregularis]